MNTDDAKLKELTALAKQGDPQAQYELGSWYAYRFYGDHSDKKHQAIGFQWLLRAAENGHAEAQSHVGTGYELGHGVSRNIQEAIRWYRLAAEQGNIDIQTHLGHLYARGETVPRDYTQALKWYRLAAENGFSPAQSTLGKMYERGQGVSQNYKEALKWYRLATGDGKNSGIDGNALYHLGRMYYEGLGVQKDNTEAIKWFRYAIDQTSHEACFTLGWMYENGLGLKQNRVAAYALYNIGKGFTPNSDDIAIAKVPGDLENVIKKMPATEVDIGDALLVKMTENETTKCENFWGCFSTAQNYETGLYNKPNRVIAYMLYTQAARLETVHPFDQQAIDGNLKKMSAAEIKAGNALLGIPEGRNSSHFDVLDAFLKTTEAM